jgi:hypothetical protein
MNLLAVASMQNAKALQDAHEIQIYTNSGPLTGTFDPSLTTSKSTDIDWYFDGVFYQRTSGTSHAISHTFDELLTHKCTAKVAGGLGLVTGVDCNTDNIVSLRALLKTKCASIAMQGNTSLGWQLSDCPITCSSLVLSMSGVSDVLCRGNLNSLSNIPLTTLYLYSIPGIFGSLSDLPVTLSITCQIYGCTGITAASIAHLVAIRDLRIYSMGWLTADVDLVLKSVSDAIHANVNHFTYATPALNIGGTNQAPSHLDGWIDPLITPGTGNSDDHWEWDAVAGKHKAISGGAAIWVANHNVKPWQVTFNGGISEDSLLGNVIGTGENTWTNNGGTHDYLYASPFTAVAGTLGDIRIKSVGSINVKVAVYDDDGVGAVPGTLLAYSAETAVVAGWNTIQLNVQVPLTASKYWLVFKTSASANIPYVAEVGGIYGAHTYEDAFANPCGALLASGINCAIAGWGLKVV